MKSRLSTAAIALLLVTVFTTRAVVADQTDPELDRLFGQLGGAEGAEAARPIENRIWEIWLHSTSPAVNDLMLTGLGQMNVADYGGALATFDRIVELAPNFAEGWNKRATLLFLLGRPSESKTAIDRVLALEPRHFGALSGLGLCDMQLGMTKEALKAFQRARALDPNLESASHNIDELRKQLARESI